MTVPFALLDDRDATSERPTSRLYTGFVREHRCVDPSTLDAMWAEVDAGLGSGLRAVVLGDYEWGAKLLGAGDRAFDAKDRSMLRVLLFSSLQHLSRAGVDEWLQALENSSQHALGAAAGIMNLEPSVDRPAFTQAIARIHDAIRAGETYQVNYTYRLHGQMYGSPVALYRRLRARQPVSFGAFVELPVPADGDLPNAVTHVLSCSPELFLRHDAGVLTARPMKGTASRIFGPEADSETARHLSLDVKNRAENLMIVDLLRNDIGRVAQVGSVKVPDLFAIEPYSTVFQMTSTVQAQVLPQVGFPDVLRAVYPCGSITGAPKHHTMELIAELESTPRGLYCGAIGWLDTPRDGQRLPDFCFNVAIRTLTLGNDVEGLRAARLGVGAGIVLDSRADDEFDECRLKARFLTDLAPGFELFETLRRDPSEGVLLLDRHLQRLGHSARALGFTFDAQRVREQIAAHCWDVVTSAHRLRVVLSHDGRVQITSAVLPELACDAAGRVGLLVAPHRLPNAQPLARHKTTLRQHYDDGVRAAEAAGAFDSLFLTVDGRLVEGGRTSVFLKIDGQWWTPPIADGALPGVMRSVVLEDSAWQAGERTLVEADLARAEAIMVCNALRGPLTGVLLVTDEPAAPLATAPAAGT